MVLNSEWVFDETVEIWKGSRLNPLYGLCINAYEKLLYATLSKAPECRGSVYNLSCSGRNILHRVLGKIHAKHFRQKVFPVWTSQRMFCNKSKWWDTTRAKWIMSEKQCVWRESEISEDNIMLEMRWHAVFLSSYLQLMTSESIRQMITFFLSCLKGLWSL